VGYFLRHTHTHYHETFGRGKVLIRYFVVVIEIMASGCGKIEK